MVPNTNLETEMSERPKHTAGPWSVSHEDFRTNDGQRAVMAPDPEHGRRRVALIDPAAGHFTRGGRFVGDPACGEMAANANLIAAAPDLLAVVEALVQAERDGYTGGLPHALILMCRDAHTKAKGGAR